MKTNFIQLIAIVIFASCLFTACQPKPLATKPYNVLFISIDDLRTELNCYGAEHIKSPHIDRLAASGVRFTNAHVQQAICMASRASIMSGIRPERKGIYTGEAVADLMPDVLTMNQFFKAQGYNIASTGKIYHHGVDTEKQFGTDYIKPKATWTASGYVTEEAIAQIELNTEHKRGPAFEYANVHDTIYKDGINTLNAVRKLAELKETDQPFFLAVGLSKPHLPFVAPKKYWDMYPDVSLPELKEMPENSNKHTMRVKGELNNYYGIPPSYAEIGDSMTLLLRRAYYACVSYADAQVGNLLDQLDNLGLTENTIVVLWGDHGYKLGDYGNWCKWSNMDIDTNIPLIFRVPNGEKNAVIKQAVEALDIYPTLADLCGLDLPEHLEGKSLVAILNQEGTTTTEKAYAYTIWPHNRWNYDRTIMGYSVTDERYNYVEWVKLDSDEVLEKELYDHQNDPDETKNVIAEDQYQTVIAELAQKLQERKVATDHNHNFKNLR
ncbi:MAG: sulfatase [Saprospiraceae bacterium]